MTDKRPVQMASKPDGNGSDSDNESRHSRNVRVATRKSADRSKYGMSGRGEKKMMTQSHGNSLGRRVETMSDKAGEGTR